MSSSYTLQILNEPSVFKKIELIQKRDGELFKTDDHPEKLTLPARDIEILPPLHHPAKKGLSTKEGQARLLHDLASIELQAMELGVRTLHEFPEAPVGFREELIAITVSESEHLRLCLQEIESLGHKWGEWPIHLNLWKATNTEDSLLDRILIVHRYLEGAGLDAGDTFSRRMHLLDSPMMKKVLSQIAFEEIGHVEFGSRWYRQICKNEKIDSVKDFPERMTKLASVLPSRMEPLAVEKRKLAGFTDEEIEYLQKLRQEQIDRRYNK